jgi:predicted ferric reductase
MIPLRTRRFLVGLMAAGLLSLPVAIFLWHTRPAPFFLTDPFPPGQSIYIMMRPAGHIAFVLIFFQIVLGSNGPALARWLGCSNLAPLHRSLGLITLSFVLLHPLLFAWSRSLRANHLEIVATFLPNPWENYWERMLFIGALGFYLFCLGTMAALFRSHLNPLCWRIVHSFNYAAFLLAFWHAISIGSETRIFPLQILYWSLALLALGLFAKRLWFSSESKKMSPAQHREKNPVGS